MKKYLYLIAFALIVAQGVYIGWYAIKTVEHVKAVRQNQQNVYEWEDAVTPVWSHRV